ncbi:MAG: hypothetical protein RLZZ142_240 [Verrucomicrobiota bacterium]
MQSTGTTAGKRRTVLVSGASGVVGYGILKSLRGAAGRLRVVGTSIYLDSVAQVFSERFEQAIPTQDSGYLEWLLDVLRRHEVDLLIPGIEADLFLWAEHRTVLEASGARLALNTPELIGLARDKWALDRRLVELGMACRIPSLLEGNWETLKEALGVPFLLKPRRGFGARGIVRVGCREEFDRRRGELGRVLLAQALVGTDTQEYTIGSFGDGQGGMRAWITLRRSLNGQGFTEKAEVADLGVMEEPVRELTRCLKPLGPTNFQFRIHEGRPMLLEINPRISSSTAIRAAFGYNEALMAVDFFLDGKLPAQPTLRQGRAVRYAEECVFYA